MITPLACAAQDIVPPKVVVTTPAGVNIADGMFQMNVTDLAIGTLRLDRFTLAPSQRPIDDPFFGIGITSNFDIYVSPSFIRAAGSPYRRPAEYHDVVHIGARASGVYTQSSPGNTAIYPFNMEAERGILALVGGAYVYTDSDGTIYTFNPSVHAGGSSGPYSQRVASIAYPDGRQESFSYNASQQLKMVSDNAGYAIIFDYGPTGDVSAACAFDLARDYADVSTTCESAPAKVTYSYSGLLLSAVTDVFGSLTAYDHSSDTYGYPISCIRPAGYSTCKIANGTGGLGRVSSQTLIDGSLWQIAADPSCNPDPDYPQGSGANCDVGVYDPNNRQTHYWFYKSSPTSMIDANGRTTTYHFDGSELQWPSYD